MIENNGYRFSYEDSKTMVKKAILMVGNSMDLMFPKEDFKWSVCADLMAKHWKLEEVNYQLMVEMERDLLLYVQEELVAFTKHILKKEL